MLIFKRLISNITIYYLSLVIIPVFAFLFIAYGSYDFKVRTLKIMGVKDVTSVKRAITSTVFNHFSRFNKVLPYANFNQILWSTNFDPKDPDNGWGFGYYKTIFPLVGSNSEIVPEGSKGYLLDNSCTYGFSPLHAYSNTFIGKSKVDDHEIVCASVYCFVSGDFNGDKVCLRADGSTYGKRVSEYDLNSKGKWQFLSLSASCNKGDAPVALYFNKLGVTDFYSLTGFVIFAYPQYELATSKDTLLSKNNLLRRNPGNTKSIVSCETFFVQSFIPFNKISLKANVKHYSALADTAIADNDLFRNWIRNKFNEDTSYYKNRANLKLADLNKSFITDRISRWEFALQIFSKEFNIKQKIFGGGFSFLNWYGFYFLKDKTQSDWPHNPFLSILLYSGIIGLLIYCFFLYKVFYYYLKYREEYPILFIFFIITFFFSFFSGDSPFDPPILGFFVILPFFIHLIHKRENLKPVEEQIDHEVKAPESLPHE